MAFGDPLATLLAAGVGYLVEASDFQEIRDALRFVKGLDGQVELDDNVRLAADKLYIVRSTSGRVVQLAALDSGLLAYVGTTTDHDFQLVRNNLVIAKLLDRGLQLQNRSTDPSVNGDIVLNGSDVKVFTGGTNLNLSNLQVRIATGSYTGDGTTSQGITGVGFEPRFVWITLRITSEAVLASSQLMWTTDVVIDDMAGGFALENTNNANNWLGREHGIISLDADGFTVDDDGVDDDPNANGMVYNYLAIG